MSGYVVTRKSYNEGGDILKQSLEKIQALSTEFVPDNRYYPDNGVIANDTGFTTTASVEDWDWMEMNVPTKGLTSWQRDKFLFELSELTGLKQNIFNGSVANLRSENKVGVYYEGGSPMEDLRTVEMNKAAIAEFPKIAENFAANKEAILEVLDRIKAACAEATKSTVTKEDMAAIEDKTANRPVAVAPQAVGTGLGA